jgi:cob(I)alamin adenosyltransferase
MVTLNKIYTKTGDDGTTALGTGERRPKDDLRIEAYGTVDETNAAVGLARCDLSAEFSVLDAMLAAIQNDLFDLGAELATSDDGKPKDHETLRIVASQAERIERDIDALNSELKPLRSFVLPGGGRAAAALHLARTVSRRAERLIVTLAREEPGRVGRPALIYMNRLSDFLFVASRYVNMKGEGDVLWVPGKNR